MTMESQSQISGAGGWSIGDMLVQLHDDGTDITFSHYRYDDSFCHRYYFSIPDTDEFFSSETMDGFFASEKDAIFHHIDRMGRGYEESLLLSEHIASEIKRYQWELTKL